MPASDQVIDERRYALIPRTLVFLTSGERVLLLRGAPHKTRWANRYNGLGWSHRARRRRAQRRPA